MGRFSSNKGQKDFELVPEGAYVARCYRVIDLGTQTTHFQGKEKQQEKIVIGWELLGTKMEDGRPFTIHERLTNSLNERALLHGRLIAWRGRQFTAEELERFDLETIINAPCQISVVHDEREERKYANVAAIMKLPAGMEAPPLENETVAFFLDEPDWDVYNSLSDSLKATIAKSPEFQEAWHAHSLKQQPPAPAAAPAVETEGDAAVTDEIPF